MDKNKKLKKFTENTHRKIKSNSILSIVLAISVALTSINFVSANATSNSEVNILTSTSTSGEAIEVQEYIPTGTEIEMYGNGSGGLLFNKLEGFTRNSSNVAVTTKNFKYGVVSAQIVYKDGTESFNTVAGPGFDVNGNNRIVRTFDKVTYQVDFSYNDINETPSTVVLEAIAPTGSYYWDTSLLEKLGYNVTTNEDYSVIKLTFENLKSGSGYSTKLPLFVGAQRNGDIFTPTFKVYETEKEADADNILIPEEVAVSAKTNLNILLNSKMLGIDAVPTDSLYSFYLGYELQMKSIPENGGTNKGLQAPLSTDVVEFDINNINLSHRLFNSPYTSTSLNDKVYIYDYGYNNGIGQLEGLPMTNVKMGNNVDISHFLPSSKSLKVDGSNRYVYDSGSITVTKTDGADFLSTSYLDRQHNEFSVTVTGFSGFEENVSNNLRLSGVPFATGGVIVLAEKKLTWTEEYILNISANINDTYKLNGNVIPDTDTSDNVSDGRVDYRFGAVSYYTHIFDYDSHYYTGNSVAAAFGIDAAAVAGTSERPIGYSFRNRSYMGQSNYNLARYKAARHVTVFDPRAFELERASEDLMIGELFHFDFSVEKFNIENLNIPGVEFLYGVRDFTGIDMRFDGSADTVVTDISGVSASMDEVEKELLNLEGFETTCWQWFDTVDEAVAVAATNDNWYACAIKSTIPTDKILDYYGGADKYVSFFPMSLVHVKILDNEYTKYLLDQKESAVTSNFYRFYTVPSTDIDLADADPTGAGYHTLDHFKNPDNGAFGYRKAVYNPTTTSYIEHRRGEPGPATSMFFTDTEPTINKTIKDYNYENYPTNPPTLVPGVDTEVWYEINAYTNGNVEVSEKNPFVVTDKVNTEYLKLDYASIYPQVDTENGIDLEIVDNGDNTVTLIWTFTKGEPGFFFVRYKI